ncbi:MAG: LamB/YcsF family protein [Solimonas sp.]
MTLKINLNADIGEGFGAYDIGNDADLMTVVRSASVACGFHAGDANTTHRLATLARHGLEAAGCRIVTIPEMLN